MNTDSKKKTQLIVLCCLVAVMLAYSVYQLMGGNTQAAIIEKPTQKAQSPAAVDAVNAVEEPAYPDMVVVATGTAVDPFVPRVGPKASESASPTAANQSKPVVQSSMQGMPPIFPVPLYQQDEPRPVVVSTSTPEEANPIQGMRLTGVIEGAQNVAIIRGGDGKRYIVREGQTIDGKCTVSSISRSGVKLSRGGKTYTLHLGSSGD